MGASLIKDVGKCAALQTLWVLLAKLLSTDDGRAYSPQEPSRMRGVVSPSDKPEARILIADDLEADVRLLAQILRGPATFASS